MKTFIAISLIVLMFSMLVTTESKLLVISEILAQLLILAALFIPK